MKVSRRNFVVGAGVAAVGAYALTRHHPRHRGSFAARKERQPNILLLITDQERHPSLLPPQLKLVNRERIFERAVRFNGMNSISGLCSMARGNIYTGLHYQHNGVYENLPLPYSHELYDDVPTIGTMLQDAGYSTAYFGKWHLTHLPIDSDVGVAKMRDVFTSYGFEYSDQPGELDGPLAGHNHDVRTAAAASAYLRSRPKGGKPWFAAINLVNPHDVMYFVASERQRETSITAKLPGFELSSTPPDPIYTKDLGIGLPANFGQSGENAKPIAHDIYRNITNMTLGEIPLGDRDGWLRYENYYGNCLRDVDRNIGTIVDTLDATNAWQDTVVIITADHGEMSGAHGIRGKGNFVYREASNVPFAVVHPEVKGAPDTNVLASHLDLAPTLLGFAGITTAETKDQFPMLKGVDLSGSLGPSADRGPHGGGRDAVLYQWDSRIYSSEKAIETGVAAIEAGGLKKQMMMLGAFQEGLKYRHGMRGSYDGRYKFARYFQPNKHNLPGSLDELRAKNDLELYDTLADPLERHNLADEPASDSQLLRMSGVTNALIASEIGSDDTEMLPGPHAFWNQA